MGRIIINSNSISLSAFHFIASRGGSRIWTGTKTHQSFNQTSAWICYKRLNPSLFPIPPSRFHPKHSLTVFSCERMFKNPTEECLRASYRASVQIILLSMWSKVSPLGQAPESMSLKTTCRRFPLMEAPSMRGNVASQSVQNKALLTTKLYVKIYLKQLTNKG